MDVNSPDNLDIDKQVCFALYRASNTLTRAYRPILDTLDLTYLQYMSMLVLWKKSPMNVKNISQDLSIDSGTLTPLLKRLEQKGLVLRQRCENDERARLISLTDAGWALKEQAEAVPSAIACKAKLCVEDAIQLKRLCDQLTNNLME
ncbi:MarR family winged helix-turn-helix transcriptional regulator [Vibrio methylphosphonaticus]|uniref:MarR family winged helix-turn-helix transcriptional regulator n=1 Tax=Vibrio methylphosphonaticus TaxID=2946866 RepID=UPI0029E803BC|nr:MarR family transcriptional regulator [Vibrio methylphosphonaticus]